MGRRTKKASRRAKSNKLRRIVLVRDPKSGIMVARDGCDEGTPERHLRQGGVIFTDRSVAAGGIIVGKGAFAIGENPIEYLARRGDLERALFPYDRRDPDVRTKDRREAAERVLQVYLRARLNQRVVASYQARTSAGKSEMSNREAAYFHLFQEMMGRLGDDAQLVVDVCCFGMMPPERETPALCAALDRLAEWRAFFSSPRVTS